MYTKQKRREIGRNLALGMTIVDAVRSATGNNSPNLNGYAYRVAAHKDVREAEAHFREVIGKKADHDAIVDAQWIVNQCMNIIHPVGGDGEDAVEGKESRASDKLGALKLMVDVLGLKPKDRAAAVKDTLKAAESAGSLAGLSNALAGNGGMKQADRA